MRPRRSAIITSPGMGPSPNAAINGSSRTTGCAKALLTHSCTSALDMAALLLDLKSGDEVILPSYTFVSTANAFVLRGAVPVFVDIREDTLNLDERLIEDAITTRTRAIVPVHYAGVSCEMDSILGDRPAPRPAGGRRRRAGNHGRIQEPGARRDRRPRQFQFSRNQEHHLGRRRQPAGAGCGVGAARRNHSREGNRSRPVLPRRGRQIHLAGCRLFISAERDHRRLPVGATRRGANGSPRTDGRSGVAITTCWNRSSSQNCFAGRSFRPIASTTGTCITCCWHPGSIASRS